MRARLEAVAREAQADVIVQPLATRAKRLLVADMDSTLIGQECIDELAAAIGIGPRVAAITERAMRGEIEFEGALRERVGLLANLPISTIAEVLENRITLNPGAKALVATMRARGGYVAIVSGGFTPFTGEIARRLGADEHRANRLAIEGDKLTGKVIEPILGANAKLVALRGNFEAARPVARGNDGGWRRRQRSADARRVRAWDRLSRQAEGGGSGRRTDRPWRPHCAALCPRHRAVGVRSRVGIKKAPSKQDGAGSRGAREGRTPRFNRAAA